MNFGNASWKIALAHPWSVWVIGGLLLGFGWLVMGLYQRERSLPSVAARLFLFGLRLVLLGLLMVLLMEPVLTEERYDPARTLVALFLDDSQSMSLQDLKDDGIWRNEVRAWAEAAGKGKSGQEGESRLSMARQALGAAAEEALPSLLDSCRVEFYTLSEKPRLHQTLVPSDPKGEKQEEASGRDPLLLEVVSPEGRVTHIGRSFQQVLTDLKGRGLAAAVLVSDGRVTAPEEVSWEEAGVPVYTVGVGSPEGIRDLRLGRLEMRDVVLLNDTVGAAVTLESTGMEGAAVEVRFMKGDEVVESRDLVLEGSEPKRLFFSHKADAVGRFEYAVEVEGGGDEVFPENNRVARSVEVLDEKIKVLYLEGPARWEYVYLKNALRRDPAVKAEYMLFEADRHYYSEGEELLREFPSSREKFMESYDVVVVGDFEEGVLTEEQMRWIADFVKEFHGGILFIAGSRHGAPQTFDGTPLEPLLPVLLHEDEEVLKRTQHLVRPYGWRFTSEGAEHPVMQLADDSEENERTWKELPGFFWHYPVHRVAPAALTLLERRPEGALPEGGAEDGDPLLLVRFTGHGRAAFMATDEVWRWRKEKDDRLTYRFWSQLIRFLSHNRFYAKDRRFALHTTPERTAFLGGEVFLKGTVLDEKMEPTLDETAALLVSRGEEELGKVELVRDPSARGSYIGSWHPPEAGGYVLRLEPETVALGEEAGRIALEVVPPVLEFEDVRSDREYLKSIASRTGGRYGSIGDLSGILRELPALFSKVAVRETRPLGHHPALYFLFVGILTLEWMLRRRWRAL
jgi:hypothetical protein